MKWFDWMALAMLTFAATCFAIAWWREGKIKVWTWWYDTGFRQFIVFDIEVFGLAVNLTKYGKRTGKFSQYGRNKPFGYYYLNLGTFSLRWRKD